MNLPPYLSRTPPPLNGIDDDENDDEEFGTFVVSSDLGDEAFDVYDKSSHALRCEDNVSEDSGFCMNSGGQTQSPCDISPLSSSYNNRGNDSVNVDGQEVIDLESSVVEGHHKVVVEELENQCITTTVDSNTSGSEENCLVDDLPPFRKDDSNIKYSNNVGNEETNKSLRYSFSSELGTNEYCRQPFPVFNSGSDSLGTDKIILSSESDEFSTANEVEVPSDVKECDQVFSLDKETETINHIQNKSQDFSNVQVFNAPSSSYESQESKIRSTELSNSSDLSSFNPFKSNIENNGLYVSSTNCITGVEQDEWLEDDDFSDFTSFHSTEYAESTSAFKATDYVCDFGDAVEQQNVAISHSSVSCTLQTAISTSVIWNCLQCFEETPAFKYQWSSSFTNMKFLQALQIDSRNILHGPWTRTNKICWNDVPSNSQNITLNANFLNCASNTSLEVIQQESIPDPHFDWVSSGLINPLQTLDDKADSIDLLVDTSSNFCNNRAKVILRTLPALSFVKAHHIIFKRD